MSRARIACAVCLALLALVPLSAQAPDGDGDGIPDALEAELGTDPAFAEPFGEIHAERTRADGEGAGGDDYSEGQDIAAVQFAPVGAGRYLWRIDFAGEYAYENSQIILYLNSDNDPKTGRKDTPDGWDYMLVVTEGTPYTRHIGPDGRDIPSRPHFVARQGNSLYLVGDLELNQSEGKSVYTAGVLSETLRPRAGVDSTGTFQVSASPASERPKVMTLLDFEASQGIRVSAGLDMMRELAEDPENVVLPIEECAFEGFIHDTSVEYREDSARRTEATGSITATVPKAGRWHPALIFYDGSGDERFVLEVNGDQRGLLVANIDDNRQRLFSLEEPVDLKEGDTLTLRAATASGTYRTEDLLLLKSLPPAWERPFEIRYLKAEVVCDSEKPEIRVTWVTTWPTECSVLAFPEGLGPGVLQRAHNESRPATNHRARVWAEPWGTYEVHVFAPMPGGDRLHASVTVPMSRDEPRGALARRSIPLRIVCPGDLSAGEWPVTQGVPLPQGAIGSSDNVRLLDNRGDEIPLQARVTARWPDATIKWLLLDFQAVFREAARATQLAAPAPAMTYALEFGTHVGRFAFERQLRVQPEPVDADLGLYGLVVDVGPRRFGLGASGVLFTDDGLTMGPKRVHWSDRAEEEPGAYPSLVGPDGVNYEPAGLGTAAMEMDGPLRSTMVATGAFADNERAEFLEYEVRAHAYAGKPFLRLDIAVSNDQTSGRFTEIESLEFIIPRRDARNSAVAVAGEEGARPLPVSVTHWLDDMYELVEGEASTASEGRRDGWIALQSDQASVGVAVRDFWQQYPKSLSVDENGIRVGLMPRLDASYYQADDERAHKLFYYLSGGKYKLHSGVSKRHELLISFAEPGHDFAAEAAYLQNPPLAVCDSEWYASTGAFGPMALPDQPVLPKYEQDVAKAMDGYLANRERGKEYGMLNFGDWWGERSINWGNIEYDTQHAFYLQFARSGDLRFYQCAQEAARHHMDVDLIRHHANPDYIGRVYAHCIGHTGDYYAESPVEGQGSLSGYVSVSHTWTEGLFDEYFLNGDRRALESALMIADSYDGPGLDNYDFTNCRVPGWQLILTMAAYRATGDPYYLNAAHVIMERVLERQTPDGGWERQMVPGHCTCTPQHHGNAGFMVAILMTGMKLYHQACGEDIAFGEERVVEALHRAARFVIEDMWVPEVKGFRYTSCPESSAGVWSNYEIFDGILYAYRLTGDEFLLEHAREGMAAAVEGGLSPFGKSISQAMRQMPSILYELERAAGQ